MIQKLLLIVAFTLISKATFLQTVPKREFRAAWMATYGNIDWPATVSTSAQEQSTFIQRIEEHRVTGMNAVFVQVRSQCDAMYASSYEPWSEDLTGTQGTAPSPYYDPLEFMITETRKKGMEFHAWINPYRALGSATVSNLAALHSSHVINQHPDWIMTAGTQKILNPGNPAVWDYVIKVVMDIVRRYDVDGIHFDDYFYPYPSVGTYNDDAEFSLYGRGIATKADWRRSNVDTLIKRLNDSIKLAKPWVKFGISPSGIWLSSSTSPSNPAGSNTSSGATQHYKDLYANSRLWIQQGWVDYLAPQIYWYMGQSGSDYSILVPWWNNNSFSRHIYSGMAGYKVGDVSQAAQFATDNTQIPDQIRLNRQNANIKGQIIYNTTSLRNNKLGFRDSLQQFFFNKPALIPTMSWKDNVAPQPATSLTATQNGVNRIDLSWTKPTAAVNELDKVKRFAIYRSTNAVVDISNANNLLTITWNDTTFYADNTAIAGTNYYYVVTALDRLQNESTVSNTATVAILPLSLISFTAKKNSNSILLNWITEHEYNTSYFEVEKAVENLQFLLLTRISATNGIKNVYSTQDDIADTKGTIYYRIKIVEKDGKISYSKIIDVAASGNNLIKVYPTVIYKNTAINVLVNQSWSKNLKYKLIDVTGRIVQKGEISIPNSIIQTQNIKNCGVYYLQFLRDEVVLQTTPIVVQ